VSGRGSKDLVVDACVAARSGGDEAVYPASKYCRDFLLGLKDFGHGMVLNPSLKQEWNNHQSRFARMWRASMVATKRVRFVEDLLIAQLRDKIAKIAQKEGDKDAMLKDCHLIEAASQADRSVISVDERARTLFVSVASELHAVRQTLWVNPEIPGENPGDWLRSGAQYETERLLGY